MLVSGTPQLEEGSFRAWQNPARRKMDSYPVALAMIAEVGGRLLIDWNRARCSRDWDSFGFFFSYEAQMDKVKGFSTISK